MKSKSVKVDKVKKKVEKILNKRKIKEVLSIIERVYNRI